MRWRAEQALAWKAFSQSNGWPLSLKLPAGADVAQTNDNQNHLLCHSNVTLLHSYFKPSLNCESRVTLACHRLAQCKATYEAFYDRLVVFYW